MSKAPTVIFMHVPKAAGSTLKSILWREYGSASVFDFRSTSKAADVARFFSMPLADRGQFRAVQGHVPFGLHRFLPGPSHYITLLRDPVERLVSTYRFIWTAKSHWRHQEFAQKRPSFAAFIDDLAERRRLNLQTLWLSGLLEIDTHPVTDRTEGVAEQELLDRALATLDREIALAAPTERFDDFLLCCRRLFGWRLPRYTPVNRTAGPALVLDPAMRARLEDLVWMDRALMAAVRARFEAQVAQLRVGGADRLTLSLKNAAYRGLRQIRGGRAA